MGFRKRGGLGTIEQVGDVWALALSEDGRFLASTTYDGRINVWDVSTPNAREKIRRYETKGSFGLCLDLVCPPTLQHAALELIYAIVNRWPFHSLGP